MPNDPYYLFKNAVKSIKSRINSDDWLDKLNRPAWQCALANLERERPSNNQFIDCLIRVMSSITWS